MFMHFVGHGHQPILLDESLRYRVQTLKDGQWVFFDSYVYTLPYALAEWRKLDSAGTRVVKISWAKTDVVHSVVRCK